MANRSYLSHRGADADNHRGPQGLICRPEKPHDVDGLHLDDYRYDDTTRLEGFLAVSQVSSDAVEQSAYNIPETLKGPTSVGAEIPYAGIGLEISLSELPRSPRFQFSSI
ncbi:hypothetical protein PCH_Pc15g01910 [Penicillium rubens Wisconsin 54-1255]|uniref:Uncharacterized protein n=1 Tax=Penicillium rubens (strain ATCC 28089 / DSM 1075 / NRRL 1951 / Wisconsin 54-1255) TaxID=500485 RepID=B6H6C6_PENRW|nr:hypothetical protein PCH_Pc15g01910 [Penicillium rubens Wisconsin 54-1255]